MGIEPDTATILFYVFDGYMVRATDKQTYGEQTPAIIDPKTKKATGAAGAAATLAALAALGGQTATAIRGDLATVVSNIATQFALHRVVITAGMHNVADTYSLIPADIFASVTPKELPTFVNAALQAFRRHMTNDSNGTGPGSNTLGGSIGPFHAPGVGGYCDFINAPLYRSVGGVEDAYGAVADLWRSYEAHRVSVGGTNAHGTADVTHTLTALPPLLAVHAAFLTVTAALSPAPAPGQQSGVALLTAIGAKAS